MPQKIVYMFRIVRFKFFIKDEENFLILQISLAFSKLPLEMVSSIIIARCFIACFISTAFLELLLVS